MSLSGSGFSNDAFLPAFVSLDGRGANPALLPALLHNDTQIVIAVPPGDGGAHTLAVLLGGRSSNETLFAYTAPIVTGITPTHGTTAGGTLVLVTGSNFGREEAGGEGGHVLPGTVFNDPAAPAAAVTPPSIAFNGVPCPLVPPFSPAARHDTLLCRSPVGAGTGQPVEVVVSGQSSSGRSSAPVLWSYDPPTVSSISPASGPTAGAPLTNVTADSINYALGPPVIVTVRGTNLGNDTSVGRLTLVQPPSEVAAAAAQGRAQLPDIPVNASFVISWNHTMVVFRLPPGSGVNIRVIASVGGQASAYNNDVEFNYDPPSVLHVLRYDKSPADCVARSQCFTFGTTKACTLEPAGCYGTEVRARGGEAGSEARRILLPRRRAPTTWP